MRPPSSLELGDAILLGEPSTWPAEFAERARAFASEFAAEEHVEPADLRLLLAEEDFRRDCGERKLVVFHCSRLLDHEVDRIRESGLAPLTPGLVEAKIEEAVAAGSVTDEQASELRRGHAFRLNRSQGRTGQICAIANLNGLGAETGLNGILSVWGGEAINGGPLHASDKGFRTGLGTPTIVVGTVPALAQPELRMSPGLGVHAVRIALGRAQDVGDVFYFGAIPPSDILGFWQPGAGEYDSFRNLPSS